MPTEEYEAASDALQAAITAIANAGKAPDKKETAKASLFDILKNLFRLLQSLMLRFTGGKGFSELRAR